MGTVIHFPTRGHFAKPFMASQPAAALPASISAPSPVVKPKKISAGRKLKVILLLMVKGVWASIWVTIVCLWPMLEFIACLDLLFQLIRTTYYWNTPHVHAGWTFLLHFFSLAALNYFVGFYRPPGFRDLATHAAGVKRA